MMAAFLAPHRQQHARSARVTERRQQSRMRFRPEAPFLKTVYPLVERSHVTAGGIDVELDDKLSGHDAEAQVIKVAEAAPYSREIKLASIPERRLRRAAATNKGCVGQ